MRKDRKGLALVLAAFLGFAATMVMGQAGGPPTESVLVTGSFACSGQVIDPPNGPGVPERSAFVGASGVLGLPVNDFLGAGGKLGDPTIAACDALAAETISTAEDGGCATTRVEEIAFEGGNYRGESRSFTYLCEGGRSRVTAVLAEMMRPVMQDSGASAGGSMRTRSSRIDHQR